MGLDAGGLLMFEAHVKFGGRDSGGRGARMRYRDVSLLGVLSYSISPFFFFKLELEPEDLQSFIVVWFQLWVRPFPVWCYGAPHTKADPLKQVFRCESTGLMFTEPGPHPHPAASVSEWP